MARQLINQITQEELKMLASGVIPREMFGPDTERPFIVVDLSRAKIESATALRDMPCPVIGIGAPLSITLARQCDIILKDDKKLETLSRNISAKPLTSMVLVQLLRITENMSLQDALTAESLAYSTLQTGPEFQAWKESYTPKKDVKKTEGPDLIVASDGDALNLAFNRPETRNAIDVSMRDALCEALDMATLDTSVEKLTLTGHGATFSTGGEVGEFGSISDPATAHWIRSLRLPAWRLARLTKPLHVHVNGAAIGAGAEIAAYGSHVTTSPKAWCQLPELKYGLIPGAGGTASLPRRIGRQRTAYIALSMDKVNAKTALEWGLIDEII